MTRFSRSSRRIGTFGWLIASLAVRLTGVAAPTDDHPGFWRLTPRDGLPAAVVYCIAQDERGFLWFGTAAGAARFDGHEFRVFEHDPADPDSLSNPGVLAIRNAPDGDLWLATNGGLDRWHGDTERFSHYRHDPNDEASLSDNAAQALELEPDGTLWVGTGRGGLNRFDPRSGKFQRYQLPGLQGRDAVNPWIRCLKRDRHGFLWIGTSNDGLYQLDPATHQFRRYTNDASDPQSLIDDRINAIAEDAAGTLWIGTETGLCRLDADRQRFERPALGTDAGVKLPADSASAVIVDHEGMIWIGSNGAGLSRYDPVSRQSTRSRHSIYARHTLASDTVPTLFEDRSGDIWVGHFPEGVSHFDRGAAAFQVFYSEPGEANSLSDNHVLSFLEDPNGDLWVGTDNGGLNHWRAATSQWTSFRHSPTDPASLGGKAAVAVYRDHTGQLWVGTWDGGLNRFDADHGTFRHYLPDPHRSEALSNAHAWQIVEDGRKQLWVATIGGGVEQYVPSRDGFVHHRHDPLDPHSLNDDIASALLVTRDGTLWVGTPKGLSRWNAGRQYWDQFPCPAGASADPNTYWIFDLAEGGDGTLWITTEGGGLIHLDPKSGRAENFRTKDDLPSDILRGILVDPDGTLWIGSNRGLVHYDPQRRAARVFDESNGLPASLFAPHARLRLASGDFLFGTTGGFIRFNPRTLAVDAQPPPVVLTGLEIFNQRIRPGAPDSPLAQSITATRRLVLPARDSVVSFQFAALCFRSAAQTEYRFKLEGFDRDWRTPGPGRRATFTNLDAGHYTLRVKAANGGGAWNEQGVALDLVIVPPWWRTSWFKTMAVLLAAGLATAIGWAIAVTHEREVRHRRELQIERERATERDQAAATVEALNQELEKRVVERTAQLASAIKELEAFSYSVSHDLRTPLRSVDGFSRALLKDYGDKLDDEGKENLRTIRAATQRMGQLIDDLLDLARVTQTEPQRTRVDLTALATTVATSLRQANPQRQIEFVIAPDVIGDGDAHLLQIALENLFGNACKFTATRAVARIEFGQCKRNGRTAYFVRDNGVGFDPAYKPKLFHAFKRLHSAKEFPGTGIGLATVERIVRRHGGSVDAEGEVDRGATFYFQLG